MLFLSRPRRHGAAILLTCAAAVACGGGDTAPPDVTPASITLTPSGSASVTSGTSLTIGATVLTKSGGPATGAVVAWASSDPTVASVVSGSVTGAKAGRATISATAGAATASVTVTVTPGAPASLVLTVQPAGAIIGNQLQQEPVLSVRDAAGNNATTSIPVTASLASGSGALSGGTTVPSDASGGVLFQYLVIAGTPGNYTLSFSAPGLATVTSAPFTMTPPPVPTIAIDSTNLSLLASAGSASGAVTLHVTAGSAAPLTGLVAGPIAYDTGQPSGWLTATLSASAAPARLTIVASAAALAVGPYHAVIPLSATGAANSPVNVSVSLVVAPAAIVTYGTPAQKVAIVDIGNGTAPSASVVDGSGNPRTDVTLSFASRATSIATVDAAGAITARSAGDAWVVATSSLGTTDSVFVIVPRSASSPMIRTDATTWVEHAGDTLLVNVVLDTRGATIGAASLAVGVQLAPPVWNFADYTPAPGPPVPVVTNSTGDILRVAVGQANGMTGVVPLLTLKLVGKTSGLAGWITLLALDVSGVDGSDITPTVTSTRLPLVIK